MAYANGRIPLSDLTVMSTRLRARADAAASYERMAAEFNKVHGPMYMTDAYRSYEIQEKIFRERYRPQASGVGPYRDVRWWNGVRYVRVNNAAAAVPGTSNHGWGVAVDFASGINVSFSSPQYRWMHANAGRYGWDNRAGITIREPWHWEYNPDNDQYLNSGGGSTVKPNPVPPNTEGDDDDMPSAEEVAAAVWSYKNTRLEKDDTYALLRAARDGTTTINTFLKPIKRGGKDVPMRQEIADIKTAVLKLPSAADVWGFKPTGVSTTGGLLAEIKQRTVDGHAGTKPLPEIAELTKKVDALTKLVEELAKK